MAILGKFDAKAFGADVAVVNGDATVTTAGSFLAGGNNAIDPGDILELGGVAYLVKEVTSATALELHTTYAAADATIAAANAVRRTAPKAVAEFVVKGGSSAPGELLFVDLTEALLDENKSRGITGPGWWQYRTFTAANGDTRHKAECIAVVSATAVVAGDDADDTKVADVASSVSITAQPANATSSSGAATFTLTTTTTGTPGALVYKWQRQTATATRAWKDITASLDTGVTYADFTTATLALSGLADASLDGYKYRVVITSAGGTEEVISDGAATITFGT